MRRKPRFRRISRRSLPDISVDQYAEERILVSKADLLQVSVCRRLENWMSPGSSRVVQEVLSVVQGRRLFVPGSDIAKAHACYGAIGRSMRTVNGRAAVVITDDGYGRSFRLQNDWVKACAKNLMLQPVVSGIRAVSGASVRTALWKQFGIKERRAPRIEAWGGEVAHFGIPRACCGTPPHSPE
jgi:hypothetical protein